MCTTDIRFCIFLKEEIERNLKKKKAKGAGGADLEEFMALEQLREKEEELKKMMIYVGRPGFGKIGKGFKQKLEKSETLSREDGTKA